MQPRNLPPEPGRPPLAPSLPPEVSLAVTAYLRELAAWYSKTAAYQAVRFPMPGGERDTHVADMGYGIFCASEMFELSANDARHRPRDPVTGEDMI